MSLLTRWEPFYSLRDEMARLQGEMDDLFEGWGLRSFRPLAVSYPPMNLWEDDDSVYAEAELPGLKLEDLEITVTGNDQLTIKGKRPPLELKNVEWHRQERGFGTFERALPLPASVDAGKVEARLENGVLTIQLAKSAAAKPRRIPVKTE